MVTIKYSGIKLEYLKDLLTTIVLVECLLLSVPIEILLRINDDLLVEFCGN